MSIIVIIKSLVTIARPVKSKVIVVNRFRHKHCREITVVGLEYLHVMWWRYIIGQMHFTNLRVSKDS